MHSYFYSFVVGSRTHFQILSRTSGSRRQDEAEGILLQTVEGESVLLLSWDEVEEGQTSEQEAESSV